MLSGVPSAARAQDATEPGLNWVRLPGAEACLSARDLAERVETRVGRVLFVTIGEAGLSVDGSVQREATRWQVTLDVSDPSGRVLGRRELAFEGDDCHMIDDAVTLVIAVTLYPDTGLPDAGIPLDPDTASKLEALFGDEPTDPDPTSLPAPVASAREPVAAPTAARGSPAPAVPSRTRWRWGFDLVATGGLGQLPGFGAGAAGYALVAPSEIWQLELGALFMPGNDVEAADGAGSARVSLLVGSVALCPWQLGMLALCGGGEVGRLRVEPEGFASGQRTQSDLVASALARAVLRPELGAVLHVRLALGLAVPLVQRSYTFQTRGGGPGRLFRMPQLAGTVELGMGVFF